MLSDSIFSYPYPQKGDIQKAVIMLHGYGSKGKEMLSLAPFVAGKIQNTIFYAPNAPIKFEFGYKWFDLDDRADASIYEQFDYLQKMTQEAKAVLPSVLDFIDKVAQKHNLKSNQITLMGFSQGGLLALMSGLLYRDCLAGVIGASAIPVSINNALSLDEVKNKPPVLLTHGMADDVVSFVGMQISQNTLKNIGCEVKTYAVPGMGHQVDNGCIDAMVKFVNSKLTDSALPHDNVSLHRFHERD